MPPTDRPLPASLHARLRAATAAAHRALEDALDLLREPPDRERFVRVLVGFHGFHRVWEPAVASQLPPGGAPPPRRALIEHDLRRLGLTDACLDAIAPCAAATALGADAPTALGSLYVLEGSTLGGQVITRHLAQAPWCPHEGLRTFAPYGDAAGARWRDTLALLAAARGDPEQIVAGALLTFAILLAWLVPQHEESFTSAATAANDRAVRPTAA